MASSDKAEQTAQIEQQSIAAAFDADAFDEAIASHGVQFVHYRAMRNPVGMVDKFDSRRPDADHSGASNGMLYTKAGCFTAIFTGNSKQIRAMEGGILNSATAQMTPSRCYDDSDERVFLHPMDRLYLKEESVLVTHQQLVDAHETGRDRLKFPAVKVQDLVDANNIAYRCDTDFRLVNGEIVWVAGRGPGINTEQGRGRVYAVRFLYRPHWYVERLVHEVRVAQTEDIMGVRALVQMPQSAVIQREYVFDNEDNDPLAAPTSRQVAGPPDGGFGPR